MATTAALHPSLPPKPLTSFPSNPSSSSTSPLPEQPTASASSNPIFNESNDDTKLCQVCSFHPPKYTCPACSMRTCSLPCSISHKSLTGCSGIRNKASYIPLNQYSWGKMMDDYVFLEDVGRKVGQWGSEIVRGGYMHSATGRVDTRGRGGMRGNMQRGRGHGRLGNGIKKTGRDNLKMQLEIQDIDMELLPVGMEKRKHNQSIWDSKNQTALLTLELRFHKPKDPLLPSSTPIPPPFVLTTHRNDFKLSLVELIRSMILGKENRVKEKEKANDKGKEKEKETKIENNNSIYPLKSQFPSWVVSLLFPDPDDPDSFALPAFMMESQLDPLTSHRITRNLHPNTKMPKKVHYTLAPTLPLFSLLKNKHFVEYPIVEIWAPDEFPGILIDDSSGSLLKNTTGESERPEKRRKISRKAGKAAITGLLGGYGSDEDDGMVKKTGLDALGDYTDSDNDDRNGEEEERYMSNPAQLQIPGNMNTVALDEDVGDGLSDEDAEGEADPDFEEIEEDVQLDSAALLELMRAAGGGEWVHEQANDNDDDDVIDWGEDDGELELVDGRA